MASETHPLPCRTPTFRALRLKLLPRFLGNQGDSVTRMTSSLFKGDLPMGGTLGGIYAKDWVRSPRHRAGWEVGKVTASRQHHDPVLSLLGHRVLNHLGSGSFHKT